MMPRPATWGSVIATAAVMLTCCATSALAGQYGAAPRGAWDYGGRTDNGFALSGPWNTPLPADVPLAPNSAAVVASIARDQANSNGLWVVNTDTYSTPIFYAAATPRYSGGPSLTA